MENVSVLRGKGGQFCTQKVSVFIEIGVFFSLKIREKGTFFKSGNADMSFFALPGISQLDLKPGRI